MANYTYAFDTGVYDTTKMGNPAPINVDANAAGHGGTFPLSAANNSFALISAGKINHENVEGVLFNYVSVASAHAISDKDFHLQAPGGPDHPDKAAVGFFSLSATDATDGSWLQMQTTLGNTSSFYAVPSGVEIPNTGDSEIPGSVFYSNTGTYNDVRGSLNDQINAHGTSGAFTSILAHHHLALIVEQNTAGAAGNTVPSVSGTDVWYVGSGFVNGLDEQSDATHIRAAAGVNTTAGYDGATVAVVTTTGRTVTYTIEHGTAGAAVTVTPVLSGFNLGVGPNMRRDVLLGYR